MRKSNIVKSVVLVVAYVLFILSGSYITEASPENGDLQSKGRQTSQHIKSVAEKAAKNAGYAIEKYNITNCIYEYTEKGTWSVFFVRKPPTPPGSHFMVFVNDETLIATVNRGK